MVSPEALPIGTTFHLHLYFDDDTEAEAFRVFEAASSHPKIDAVGRFHPAPVGPHPCRQFQMLVSKEALATVECWLDEIRVGLTVLIHPEVEDDYWAHTVGARWLGAPRPLKLETLR